MRRIEINMTKLNRATSLAVLLGAALASAIPSPGAEGSAGAVPPGDAGHGKQLYRRYCIGCHGVKGDGQGENGVWLDPRPRDFTSGTFKCRSTPTGTLPLDTDLYATIGRGLYASGMPPWGALMASERADLLVYIKEFSPRFKTEKLEAPLEIPAEPADTPESAKRGDQIYQRMECWKCHGKDGSGNGPSAATLTDNKERPIVPYDFTKGTRFKCGSTNQDVYRIFMTGLDGTPMPSFHDDLKPEEAWDLVHYLRTLQPRANK
jgi:mono/diheme cytochrome c family protein